MNKTLAPKIAAAINERHGWRDKNANGWMTPARVIESVMAPVKSSLRSHPMTQEILGELNRLKASKSKPHNRNAKQLHRKRRPH